MKSRMITLVNTSSHDSGTNISSRQLQANSSYFPRSVTRNRMMSDDVISPPRRLPNQTPQDSPGGKASSKNLNYIIKANPAVSQISSKTKNSFDYQKSVEEAFRPTLNFDSLTKDIFLYNFKKIGFDLEKIDGEGINHYHIR